MTAPRGFGARGNVIVTVGNRTFVESSRAMKAFLEDQAAPAVIAVDSAREGGDAMKIWFNEEASISEEAVQKVKAAAEERHSERIRHTAGATYSTAPKRNTAREDARRARHGLKKRQKENAAEWEAWNSIYADRGCTCHLGHPPCSYCVDRPLDPAEVT